jgi:hypothetical protein
VAAGGVVCRQFFMSESAGRREDVAGGEGDGGLSSGRVGFRALSFSFTARSATCTKYPTCWAANCAQWKFFTGALYFRGPFEHYFPTPDAGAPNWRFYPWTQFRASILVIIRAIQLLQRRLFRVQFTSPKR